MKGSSLALRAVIAVGLLVGFYLLAMAIAGILLYIPYAEWSFGNRLHIKLALACIAGAAVILWSIVPRPDRFEMPGPEVKREDQPELFGLIDEVAGRTSQEPPAAVYMVPDVNAWVAQRGGLMGIGSRRVMGIGLPLMEVTTAAQFKAILAHEFGHYYGGDTKLGPWIYKTRQTIGRTLSNLAGRSYLQKPFEWYGALFLRVTHAISRQQEVAADRLAASLYGGSVMIDALKAAHGYGSSFKAYWFNEMAPVLDAGRRPPLSAGYRAFLSAPPIAAGVSSTLEDQLQSEAEDSYDTHPTLARRIEVLKAMPDVNASEGEDRAALLLKDVERLERQMLSFILGSDPAQALAPISWESVGEDIYLPLWTTAVAEQRELLAGMTVGSAGESASQLSTFARRLPTVAGGGEERQKRYAAFLLAASICLSLKRTGWALQVRPGEQVALDRNGTVLEPFALVNDLASGKLGVDEWHRRCEEAGISGLSLTEN